MTSIIVNGNEFAYSCVGEGSPTIVLETGVGAESAEWGAVESALTATHRVFRYDRAGRGASGPVSSPRDAAAIADELLALLHAANVPGPYLLVGQSFGGLIVRAFAARNRQDVVGLVLAESMHADQFDILGPAFPPASSSDTPLLSNMRRFWNEGWRNSSFTAEKIDMMGSLKQDREITTLGDLPVHIVTGGGFLREPVMADSYHRELHRLWTELQAKFLNLSSRAKQTLHLQSGHFVQRDAPAVIVDAIRMVLASGRGE